ncbi:MAG: nucleotide exchange factor GrpE [Bacteroidetes bacterium]|nr:nucleotide exchange factor GrpE [Bacteroidota bacterium]
MSLFTSLAIPLILHAKKYIIDNTNEELIPEQETPIEENASAPISETEATAKLSLEDELAEMKDKYLRLYSDFENFKRRTSKERVEFFKTAGQEIITAMLPVLDDFERATKSMDTAQDVSAVKEGVTLVHHKLKNILTQKGLKEMEAQGKDFDADFHEAITNIPAPSPELKGKVVDAVEKGYFLGDKVIRYAKVVVGE